MIITINNLDPVAFSVSFIQIRWYSLAYIFGILFSFFWLKYSNKQQNYLSNKALDEWITYSVLSILIGGRLGYVLFYNLEFFIQNPFQIIAFWNGGMSFHGGLIGAIFGMLIFSRNYKINYWILCDNIAISTPFGLLLGRIANFINLELYGRKTDGNYGVIFPNTDGSPRHPSQIYEAFLEGLLLLIIMQILYHKTKLKNSPKKLSGVFLAGYAICRFIIEFFREPDANIGLILNYITMGQILSVPIFIFGLYLLIAPSKIYK